MRRPLAGAPLASGVQSHERVAIVIADVTRPLPSERLVPWLLRELRHVPADRIAIVIGTRSHRATTTAEMGAMLGDAIASGSRPTSGYPLDQNLYQAVKGMSDAAQVVSDGGFIAAAARCNDGFPDHGNSGRSCTTTRHRARCSTP